MRTQSAVATTGWETARPVRPEHETLLSPDCLAFLASLHEAFEGRRQELLRTRKRRQARLESGARLAFLPETEAIRSAAWRVTSPPADLADRRVEITGPPERKMMINALNSGAKVYMADFEDSMSPTWANLLDGQANVRDAVRGALSFTGPDGRLYAVRPDPATLVVRPRGLHLDEPRMRVGGRPLAASLFDFGLFVHHNARTLVFHGSAPYVYLAKLESHLEARWWGDVFAAAERLLGLPENTIRPTVLVETLPAAFEMEEILFELRHRSPALNAGRWDYLFSTIKANRARPGFVLPDRADCRMTAPFLWAYTHLLVATCHRRGAYAIGGMAAYVPDRRDPQRNEAALAKVRADKEREAADGFDGTWVAHPDLVPVALACFDARMAGRTNQLDVRRDDVAVGPADLLYLHVPGASVTEAGLRSNIRVTLVYLAAWLSGKGCIAIDSLMEDTATAEIARSQVWQWVRQGVVLEDARTVTPDLVRLLCRAELGRLRAEPWPDSLKACLDEARGLFDEVALGTTFVDWTTTHAMERLLRREAAA
jgi:malate synthase